MDLISKDDDDNEKFNMIKDELIFRGRKIINII